MNKRVYLIILIFALILAACQGDSDSGEVATIVPTVETAQNDAVDEETAVVATSETTDQPPTATPPPAPPTATAPPPKSLTICMAQLPQDLYLYGDQSDSAATIRQTIFEPLYTTLGYDYQPLALTTLPDLESGGAIIQTVLAQTGDRVVNAAGNPVTLQSGVQIKTANDEIITYDGGEPVEMVQMVVEFVFEPLVWSDGTAVTAVDSVFSFNIAADATTPINKEVIERTAVYSAKDEQTAVWTGLPGYIDRTYFLNVWTPLPSHQLSRFTPADLLSAPESTQTPLGYGPFVVQTWQDDQIILNQNPNYYQADPALGQIIFVQEEDGLNGIRNGRCQIALSNTVSIDQTPDVQTAQSAGELTPIFRQSLIFEHIDFGINPADEYDHTRPDWFEDVNVRRAFMHCIDRQKMLDDLQYGQGVIYDAYVAGDHPAFPADAASHAYDPALGNQLLDQTGMIDNDGNGIRELVDEGVTTPISITLGTDDLTPLRRQINEQVQADLEACGIAVTLYDLPAIDWYANGPFSPLFGRRFDLATFAWLSRIEPPCQLYLSENITGPEEEGFGGWGNVNATGWSNEAYDAACQTAQTAFINSTAYHDNHETAVRIFTEELPILPLFSRVELLLAEPTVTGINIDATQRLPLWNAASIDWTP